MLVGQLEFPTVRYCECGEPGQVRALVQRPMLSPGATSAVGLASRQSTSRFEEVPAPRAPGPLGKISRGRLKSLQRRMSSLEALPLGADPCYAPVALCAVLRPGSRAPMLGQGYRPALPSPSAFNLIKDLRTEHLNSKRGHCRAEQFATCALLCALPSGILRCRRQRRLLRSRVSGAHWLLSTEDRSLSSSSRCLSV